MVVIDEEGEAVVAVEEGKAVVAIVLVGMVRVDDGDSSMSGVEAAVEFMPPHPATKADKSVVQPAIIIFFMLFILLLRLYVFFTR